MSNGEFECVLTVDGNCKGESRINTAGVYCVNYLQANRPKKGAMVLNIDKNQLLQFLFENFVSPSEKGDEERRNKAILDSGLKLDDKNIKWAVFELRLALEDTCRTCPLRVGRMPLRYRSDRLKRQNWRNL